MVVKINRKRVKKAQFSIEFMTVLVIFLVIFTPLVLLLLSQDKIKQEQIMIEQENLAIFKIKTSIENVFSSCPSTTTTQVYFPRNVNVTIFNSPANDLYIKVDGGGGVNSYIRKVNAQASNTIGTIQTGSGFININISCITDNGNIKISIGGLR